MSDFRCVLIEPSVIADITSQEVYGVESGASQSTFVNFPAVATSNSSVVFSCLIPSENIVVDRHVLMKANLNFTIQIGTSATPSVALAGTQVFNYGLTDALQAFPINSLFNTTQATVNNVSTSTNTGDIIAQILRMNDKRMLTRYNGLTPCLPDSNYGVYADGVGMNNNVLASFGNNSYDDDFVPRGAFPTDITIVHTWTGGGGGTDSSPIALGLGDFWSIYISAQITEPFLALAPFVNTDPLCKAGMLGVNNMNFNLTLDSTCSRLFSTGNTYISGSGTSAVINSYITNIQLGTPTQPTGLASATLLFNFLSLQPEQYAKISTRNVFGVLDYPRYLTSNANATVIAPNASSSIQTQSIQLNQVSDLIIICVRQRLSDQNWKGTSGFLTVDGITINFNNTSGILASATQEQLYKICAKNGSAQSYLEFIGEAQDNNNMTGIPTTRPTVGSLLVFKPVYDWSLPSYLSSSSLGAFNLQMTINFTNQYPYAILPEVCVLTVNSGLMVLQQGTAQMYSGILTKNIVLETKEKNPVAHLDSSEYSRLVGGQIGNAGMSMLSKMVKHYKKMKGGEMSGGQESGGQSSGGAGSGGQMSGGRRRGGKLSNLIM